MFIAKATMVRREKHREFNTYRETCSSTFHFRFESWQLIAITELAESPM
jgi:hypothetical protein